MRLAELRRHRLRVQGLRSPFDVSAPEVVRRFVAVQAQEFVPAQWGLAGRVVPEHRPDAASLAAALDRGEILRTHVLRPTWHFLHPADARWMLELSAERVHRQNGTYYRKTGLTGETAARGLDLVAASLSGGHRTRAELTEALEAGGMPLAGLGFTYLLMLAELERVAISGANSGKQRTYADFDERVPASAPKPRDDALAELASRFIASRGPVTERDFAAWSGFTLGDARLAFAEAMDRAAGGITTIEVDETTHWLNEPAMAGPALAGSAAPDPAVPGESTAVVDLLQAYDEYIMGYAAPRAYLLPDGVNAVHAETALHALMIDGVMAGRWAPAVRPKHVVVRVVPWREFSADEEAALAASASAVGRFFGLPVELEREPVDAGLPA